MPIDDDDEWEEVRLLWLSPALIEFPNICGCMLGGRRGVNQFRRARVAQHRFGEINERKSSVRSSLLEHEAGSRLSRFCFVDVGLLLIYISTCRELLTKLICISILCSRTAGIKVFPHLMMLYMGIYIPMMCVSSANTSNSGLRSRAVRLRWVKSYLPLMFCKT